MAKAWETRRANAAALGVSPHEFKKYAKAVKAVDSQPETDEVGRQAFEANMSAGVNSRGLPSTAPGQGEIIGGADDQMTERLMKLARKQGGDILVKSEIRKMQAISRHEGAREADHIAIKRLVDVQQIIADRIVCGFIAEMEACMQQHGGFPTGATFNVNGFTVTKLIDALNKAGYTANGKR